MIKLVSACLLGIGAIEGASSGLIIGINLEYAFIALDGVIAFLGDFSEEQQYLFVVRIVVGCLSKNFSGA